MVQTRRKKAEQQEETSESGSPPPTPPPIRTGRRGRPSKTKKDFAPAVTDPIAEISLPKENPPAEETAVHILEKDEELNKFDLVFDESVTSRQLNGIQINQENIKNELDSPPLKNCENGEKVAELKAEVEETPIRPEEKRPLEEIDEVPLPAPVIARQSASMEIDSEADEEGLNGVNGVKQSSDEVVESLGVDNISLQVDVSEKSESVETSPLKNPAQEVPKPKSSYHRPHIFHPAAHAFDHDDDDDDFTNFISPPLPSTSLKTIPIQINTLQINTVAFAQPGTSSSNSNQVPPENLLSMVAPPPPPPPPGSIVVSAGSSVEATAPPAAPAELLSPTTPFQMQIKPISFKNPNVRCTPQNALLFSPTKRGTLFGSPAKNVPPPSVVEPPKLSSFGSSPLSAMVSPEAPPAPTPQRAPTPPPPPAVIVVEKASSTLSPEATREKRQKAELADERVTRRREYSNERNEYDRRREERDRRWRRNDEFHYDRRYSPIRDNTTTSHYKPRVPDRIKNKLEAVQRAQMLAQQHREDERARKANDHHDRHNYRHEYHHHHHHNQKREKSIPPVEKTVPMMSTLEIPLPPSPQKPPVPTSSTISTLELEMISEPSESSEFSEKPEKSEETVKDEPKIVEKVEESPSEAPVEVPKVEKVEKIEEDTIPEHERVVPPYEMLGECKYLTKNSTKKKTESLICDCYESGHNCSDNTCVNRAMLTECPASCPTKCKNQRFTKRKYAAVEAFHTGTKKGCGLKALKDIKKGQFIIEYVGEMLERDDYEKRKQKYAADKLHKHHYLCDTGNYTIDATTMGNPSRFINHSCEPNAVCEKWSVPKTPGDVSRIGFFAKRNISSGEEITFDYQFVNYGRDAQACYCGMPSCTGWIGEKPEDYSDDDEDSDDDELVTTREIEEDEEDQRLSELERMTEDERKAEIDELMSDYVMRNRKHARRIIKIGERMTDSDQKIDLIADIFSQDMPFHVQLHYAKEGMTTLMYEWLSQDNFSVSNLKLMQKVLQTLHGEVFVSCARSDRDLVDLVSRLAKLGDLPESADVQIAMESIVSSLESTSDEIYENISENVYNDVLANFHRLREMAVRLNHHWFNRSVNFRIPKKVREPEVLNNHNKEEEDKSSLCSPALSSSYEYESRWSSSYPSSANNRYNRYNNDYNNHGSGNGPYHRPYHHDYNRQPREFFRDMSANGMERRKYPAHQYETTFFNPSRKRWRRSRSRSRSPSPFKRRKIDEYERYRRTPDKKSPPMMQTMSSQSSQNENYDREMPSSSSCSAIEAINKVNAAISSISTSSTSNTSLPSVQPSSSYHMPYDYGLYESNSSAPYPPYFYPPHQPPNPPSGFHDFMPQHNYPPWPPAETKEAEKKEKKEPVVVPVVVPVVPVISIPVPAVPEPLNLSKLPTLEELSTLYDTLTTEELNARYALLSEEQKLIQRKLVEIEFRDKNKEAEEKKALYKTPEPLEIREPPPKPDRYLWSRAKTDNGDTYYYHKLTKLTQWSPPRPDQGELDPNDRTPPDTTEESTNSSDHDEKSRVPSSLSARVGEMMEGSYDDMDTVIELNSHRDQEASEREKSLLRVDEARLRMNEQERRREHKAKCFRNAIEKVVGPIVLYNVRKVKTTTPEKTTWLIKLLTKEMYKRESKNEDFNYKMTENTERMVRKYTETFMARKMANGGIDIWKGYK